MGTLPANLNIPNCLNVKFNKPQGKMKIAVLCLVMVLAVVIKAAPMKEDLEINIERRADDRGMNIEGNELQEMNVERRANDQGMNIEGNELQEMNVERRANAEAFERLLDALDMLDTMAKREPRCRGKGCPLYSYG